MSDNNIFSVFAVVTDANGQRNPEFVIKEQCQMGLHQQSLLPTNKTKNHDVKNENKKDRSKLFAHARKILKYEILKIQLQCKCNLVSTMISKRYH